MMDKGLHASSPPIAEALESAVRKIPLPNQMPKGIDFANLPTSSLKSATVESIIHQNEDLMARLSIALRRASEYEESLHRLEQENTSLRTRFETLKDQYLLTQEKDRISGRRFQQTIEESTTNKRQLEKLEKVYSELFVQAQAFQQQVIKLERHQSRLRKVARDQQKRKRALEVIAKREEHLSSIHHQAVQSYEAKLNDVRAEIESMRTKIGERDALYAEKVKLENQLVYVQRQAEIQREERESLLQRLSAENTSMRIQLKESLIATEAAQQELARLTQELPSLRNEKQNLMEQVESLQALWTHKQAELESSEQKNQALQKLNQSISLTLNQQRKEIHGLEQQLERERFTSAEKIKTLVNEIQMLKTKA